MVKSISVAATLFYAAVLVSGSKHITPPVELNLVAPWSAPDPFLEIVETIVKDKPLIYHGLITGLTDINRSSPLQQQYDEALALAATYLDGSEELDIVRLNLALHASAPVIEAHHQYYNQTVVPFIKNYDPSCEVWAQIGSYQACSVEELEAHLQDATPFNNNDDASNELEHLYCNPCQGVPLVNVYTPSINPAFTAFHLYLSNKVNEKGTVRYSLRYKPFSDSHQVSPLYLTGYGVELALKNTDYLVIDDRSSTDKQDDNRMDSTSFIKQQLGNLGKRVNQVLFDADEISTIEPLTPDEVKLLGLKATQFIMTSKDPLSTLAQLSQDFPKYAHKISTVALNDDMVNEIISNQQRFVQAGVNAMWINGRKLEDDEINPFSLTRNLKRERTLVNSLLQLGATKQQAIDVITNSPLSKDTANPADGSLKDVFDVRVPDDDQIVLWWNDLEKDSQYSSWYPDLSALLRPTYPGQMRAIRRNIYNVILVEDLASSGSLQRLTHEIQNMIKQNAPLRFGLLPYLNDQNGPSTLAAKTLQYLVQKYGKATGMSFLEQIQVQLANAGINYATEQVISSAMESTEAAAKNPVVEINLGWSDIKELPQPAGIARFLKRMGINRLGNDQGVIFMNGQYLEHSDEKPWTRVLMAAMNIQTQILTKSVYLGEVNEEDNVYDFFLNQPYVSSARNAYVAVNENHPLQIPTMALLKNSDGKYSYLQSGDDDSVVANIWAVGNMNSPVGIKLALNAIQFIETNNEARLSIIHLPQKANSKEDEETEFSDILYNELYNNNIDLATTKKLLELELQHWQEHNDGGNNIDSQHIMKSKPLAPGSPIVDLAVRKKALSKWSTLGVPFNYEENDGHHHYFQKGQDRYSGLLVNGRIVGPFANDDDFTTDDFAVLWKTEKVQRITPVINALQQAGWSLDSKHADIANTIMYVTATLVNDNSITTRNILFSQEDTTTREKYYTQMDRDHSRVYINKGGQNDKDGDNDVYAEIGVLLDPISEDAQKWSTILQVLSELKGVAIDVHWNPVPHLGELPLKRFYRYVLDSDWHFTSDDGYLQRIQAPTAHFDDLPADALYTLGVDTMDSWHVTVKEANVDLDNIQLATLEHTSSNNGVHAVYELERILVEGHCIDSADQHPPRGLQFVLGTDSHPVMTDTIVMANLGYFQLKAQPGIYQLRVRPGRSSDVYGIESIGTQGKWIKTSSTSKSNLSKNLVLTSFEGLRLFPSVKKNPGMESEDVLADAATPNQAQEKESILSSLSHRLFGKKDNTGATVAPTKQQADINIFSVASGHLYERFLAIMMASVMEHTDSTVKFWFIENFLSPSFKDFVPELSKRYGFDYEMVTYKWPSWLNAQKEKQRTIWGYKILFLDVLFPLDLEKVIFVDADQIVRTDLQELVDLDLHGAPYGYTPFCSDRHEMDGFRFWSQGYWKDHLRGRPYHISALYVVDLVRFRQMAAGDRLRAQYQQLSADPNSLANLDQDLPNNMIHMVPIFSLPQEWLWCETWCSDESLKTAKTIDLCNNPLTKEPKLDRARRQVPEWETYDTQIEAIRQAFLQKKPTDSHTTLLANGMDATTKPESNHIKDEL
ncbi:UDP-glucose:glycoprotein glucosyltransferase-domain-containing protein [Chlamydoabsidia padenii]|nr:UDP-glucose:glycoprotein glucosyltransferase-domain-containing protein [Chlamydoabsidia padenii]